MKEMFTEVRCDYNNGKGFWTVDAWRSSDPNAEGEVIAGIHDKTGDVFYSNVDARISPMAQAVIEEKVAEIRARRRVRYILTVVNQDYFIATCDAYPTFEGAQAAMRNDIENEVENLSAEGFSPVTKIDEHCAAIKYGNEMLFRYQIKEVKI